LTQRFPNLSFKWIKREDNEEADLLARNAYEGCEKSNVDQR
jgi:ribonuclease HI